MEFPLDPRQPKRKFCCRPHQRKGSTRAWKNKNRKHLRGYNRAWRIQNPEKVKAQKKRSAEKYKLRRKMLYASRSPERIAEDNRKAMERYYRRYPNRTPEQVAKDRERNKAEYAKERELREAGLAALQPKGPGRPTEPENQKSYFGWGQKVEKEIPAGLKQDKTAIVNARHLVAENSRMPYDTIVLYHQRFRKTIKELSQSALVLSTHPL